MAVYGAVGNRLKHSSAFRALKAYNIMIRKEQNRLGICAHADDNPVLFSQQKTVAIVNTLLGTSAWRDYWSDVTVQRSAKARAPEAPAGTGDAEKKI